MADASWTIDRKSPILALEDKELTQSALVSFGLCKRKFHWTVNEKLEPDRQEKPLALGDLIHKLLADMYTRAGVKNGTLLNPTVDLLGPQGVIEKWRKTRENTKYSDDDYELIALAISMMMAVESKFGDGSDMKIIGVEFPISVPVRERPGWWFRGKLDLLIEDDQGNLVIIDHKSTTKQRKTHGLDGDLNYQGWDYCAIASRFFQKHVSRFMLQGLRKKIPTEVKALKSGLPSAKVTPDTYLARFDLDFEKGKFKELAEYDEIDYRPIRQELRNREDRDGNEYVWRKSAHIPMSFIKRFWHDVAEKIDELSEEKRWLPSWGACDMWKRRCAFSPLCVYGDSPTARMGFKTRTGHYLPSVKEEDDDTET